MTLDMIAFQLKNPELTFPNPSYPSGIYSYQEPVYDFPYEERDYPILSLANPIYDNEGNYLPVGYYLIALSKDNQFLLFIQSNIIKAKIPVATLTKVEPNVKEIEERAAIKADMDEAKLKNKLKKYKQYYEELENFDKRRFRRITATIEDSGQGYYIVKYSRFDYKATGLITK